MTMGRLLMSMPLAAASQQAKSATAANLTDPRVPAPSASRDPGQLMAPADAAALLDINAKVLERWRGTGEGPAYVKLSSKTIRYRREDIEAFVAGRVRVSTAEV